MPPTARTMSASVKYIKEEYEQVIKSLARTSHMLESVPSNSGGSKKWYERLDKFLTWLETDVQMTAELKDSSVIGQALEVIYAKEGFYFPSEYAGRAKVLYERWESEGWDSARRTGGDDVEMEDAPSKDGTVRDARRTSSSARIARVRRDSAAPTGGVKAGTIKLPPPEHTIWGLGGIMYGVASKLCEGNKKSFVIDPRYQKRNSKVHGHNGIEVGTWYPRQLIALFRSAHGHQQAGIAGDRYTGAFSIVVSGQYDTLDQDRGQYLYYSGSRSHDNENPREPAPSAPGTLALHTSLETGKLVRVLRSSTGKSKYAPLCGIRYDGLYTVVSVSRPKNARGGLYEQFKLERVSGQGEINILRPDGKEIGYEGQIKQVNTSRWETLVQASPAETEEES